MTAPAIEPGLKGTLSPEEYTTKTAPHWGETYQAAMASYGDMDYVSIAYATDAAKAAALIPKELELLKIPALPGQSAANIVFAKYRECDLGPYMEVIVSIPVLHKGQVFGFITGIYVDNDSALLAGRELGGYPKKIAQITMRNFGNLFLSHMGRGTIQNKNADANFTDLASASIKRGSKLFSVPLPADKTPQLAAPFNMLLPLPAPIGKPQDYVIPTMALRRVPGIGPGPDGAAGAEVMQLVGTPWHVTRAEFFAADDVSVELFSTKEDPLREILPCNTVLGAYILRGAMYTRSDEWILVENLKANNAKPVFAA